LARQRNQGHNIKTFKNVREGGRKKRVSKKQTKEENEGGWRKEEVIVYRRGNQQIEAIIRSKRKRRGRFEEGKNRKKSESVHRIELRRREREGGGTKRDIKSY